MFAFRSETKVSVLLANFHLRLLRGLGFTIMIEIGNYSQLLQASWCYLLRLRLNYYYYSCLHLSRDPLNSFLLVLSFCFETNLLYLLHSLRASEMDHLHKHLVSCPKSKEKWRCLILRQLEILIQKSVVNVLNFIFDVKKFTSQTFVANIKLWFVRFRGWVEARFREWCNYILLTWILVLRAWCRYLCWLKLQSRGTTIGLC